jgi:hypothetical protein
MIKHEILPDGRLRLFADEETRAALKEVQLENELVSNGHLSFSANDETEFMEHLIANSELYWLDESDLPGDLTSAPALGILGEECDELLSDYRQVETHKLRAAFVSGRINGEGRINLGRRLRRPRTTKPMVITKIKNSTVNEVIGLLCKAIYESRFTAEINTPAKGKVKISEVRLRQSKSYCGNHPKACENTGTHRKHPKNKILEGADWVEFNDLLNDVMDANNIEANIQSSAVIIRKGRLRRIHYDAQNFVGNAWQWDKDAPDWCWEDHMGNPPNGASKFPLGTPGIYNRKNHEYFCVG